MKRKMLDIERKSNVNVKFYKDELGRTRVIRPTPEEERLREIEMLMARRGKHPTPKDVIKRPEGSGLPMKPKPKPLPRFL